MSRSKEEFIGEHGGGTKAFTGSNITPSVCMCVSPKSGFLQRCVFGNEMPLWLLQRLDPNSKGEDMNAQRNPHIYSKQSLTNWKLLWPKEREKKSEEKSVAEGIRNRGEWERGRKRK